jgi:hypothetical protein
MKQHCQTNSLWDPGKDEDVSNAEQGTSTRHYVVGPTEVGWSSVSRSKNRTSLPDSHHEQQAGPTTWTAKLKREPHAATADRTKGDPLIMGWCIAPPQQD